MVSNQNIRMQETLKRYLSQGNTPRLVPETTDKAVALDIASKLGDCFSKFSAEVAFVPNAEIPDNDGSELPNGSLALIFAFDQTAETARIDLPPRLIRALFAASLGRLSRSTALNSNERLSKIERHFADIVGTELATAVSACFRPALFEKIFIPDEAGLPNMPEEMEHFAYLASVNGCEAKVFVHFPIQPRMNEMASDSACTLAKKSAQLVMEPELRLRLRALTLSDIAKLKRGDILSVTPGSTGAVAYLAVRGNFIMSCELGQIGGRYSARVIGSANASTNKNAASMVRRGK